MKLFDESDRRVYGTGAGGTDGNHRETKTLRNQHGRPVPRRQNGAVSVAVSCSRALAQRGGEIILSSDSHDGASLCYKFAEAAELAKACGFKVRKNADVGRVC